MTNGFVANLSSRKRNRKGFLQSIAAATTTNKHTNKTHKNKKKVYFILVKLFIIIIIEICKAPPFGSKR